MEKMQCLTLGERIALLRRQNGMTQEQLSSRLNLTYQAVSKWENDVSQPDARMLVELAKIFQVTTDELLGVACPEQATGGAASALPWEDDGTLRAVLFVGHTFIGSEDVSDAQTARRNICFQYEGEALNIESDFDISCGSVGGNVMAGGNATCEEVGGSVSAGGNATCGAIGGRLRASGSVTCEEVGGGVSAGGNIYCKDVDGDVQSGGNASCGDIGGNLNAGGNVDCGDVGGDAIAGRDLYCRDIGGGAQCVGEMHCK